MSSGYRISACIDLQAVKHNFEVIHERLSPGVKIIAVVKTNAYGHGSVPIAQLAEKLDYVWGFAVATVEEGRILREAGIRKPVMILGYVFPGDLEEAVSLDLRCPVFTIEMGRQLSEAAGRLKKTARFHLAADTGMNRIGMQPGEESAEIAAAVTAMPNLELEGMFTHFARADETDKTSALEQFRRYTQIVQSLEDRGITILMKHVANSAAIMELDQCQLDAVRAGIILYGIYPSDEVDREKLKIQSVMSLVSHITHVKTIPAGSAISYGGTYVTERESRIATIPVGYGDGYPRSLSNKGYVLIHGRRAPIRGRVCMDQFMVDVTDIPAQVGDKAVLMGRDGEEEITVYELSELSGRFPYEFTCMIAPRVPRVFSGS